jgi:hypothetical protein
MATSPLRSVRAILQQPGYTQKTGDGSTSDALLDWGCIGQWPIAPHVVPYDP